MKQYTNSDQTAKLIELGFEKPKSIEKVTYIEQYGCGYETAYSIGELIEMLPQIIEFGENGLLYSLRVLPTLGGGWAILYYNEYDERNNELIDALYNMCVKLKQKGVI